MAQLILNVAASAASIDLPTQGPLDWFIYPNSLTPVKKSATNYLTVGRVGASTDNAYNGTTRTLAWTGGAPTASGSNGGGIYALNGAALPVGSGYSVSAPADTSIRTLKVYAGNFNCSMQVKATISDGSTATQTTTFLAATIGADIVVDYAAASAGQIITVEITVISPTGGCNISLSGAALSGTAPATLTAPDTPTSVTAVAGPGSLSVSATPGATGGSPVTRYDAKVYAVSNNALLGSGFAASFPIAVSNLPSQLSYVKVTATNAIGTSAESAASSNVTPDPLPKLDINDAKLYWSPGSWDDYGTYKQAIAAGSYLRVAFSGATSVAVNIDVSAFVGVSLSSSLYPVIRIVLDGHDFTDVQLTSSSASVTRTGMTTGAHTLDVYIRAIDTGMDRWATPNGVRVTSVTLPNGGTFAAPALRTKRMEYHGDSITEGWLAAGPTNNNAMHTAVPMIAQALDAEYGQFGYSGQGYDLAGGSRPAFRTSALFYSSARSRLVNGLLAPMPDYICVEHGTNGTTTQAHVLEVIDAFRAAAPQARIFMLVPANGRARSAITSAVAARSADTKLHLVDLGTAYQAGINQGSAATGAANLFAADALHRNLLSNAIVASGYTSKIQAVVSGTSGSGSPVANSLYIDNGRIKRSASGATALPGFRIKIG